MAEPKDPSFVPPVGSTLSDQGYWLDANGDLVPGQKTPGMMGNLAAGNSSVQIEEGTGKPYILHGGKKTYLSPVAMGTAQGGPDQGSFLHTGSQWNQQTGEWENPINWSNLMSLAVGGGLGVGALSAAGAFGGAGAAGAGGTLPSTTIGAGYAPGIAGGTGMAGGAGAGAGAGAAAGAGVLPSTTIGTGMTGTTPGAATALGAGGAGTSLSQLAGAGSGSIPAWLRMALQAGMGGLSSGLASNAAGNANQAQLEAIKAAMAWQQKIYGDQQAAAKPYQDLGQQGVTSLSNFQGFNTPFVPGQPRASYAAPSQGGGGAPSAPFSQSNPPPGMRVDTLAQLPSFAAGQLPPSGQMPQAGLPGMEMAQPMPITAPPSAAPGGQMVTLKGPNGNTQQVPAEIAPRLIAMGAVRVG